jgi:hypothetical protein
MGEVRMDPLAFAAQHFGLLVFTVICGALLYYLAYSMLYPESF